MIDEKIKTFPTSEEIIYANPRYRSITSKRQRNFPTNEIIENILTESKAIRNKVFSSIPLFSLGVVDYRIDIINEKKLGTPIYYT